MRRRVALLLLWVGLLGTALPTLACAAGIGECCPAQAPYICGGNAGLVGITAAALCCSSAPRPAYVLSVGPADPRARASLHASGSPDALRLGRWAAFSADFPGPDVTFVATAAHRTDGQLSYLRTGRLRL